MAFIAAFFFMASWPSSLPSSSWLSSLPEGQEGVHHQEQDLVPGQVRGEHACHVRVFRHHWLGWLELRQRPGLCGGLAGRRSTRALNWIPPWRCCRLALLPSVQELLNPREHASRRPGMEGPQQGVETPFLLGLRVLTAEFGRDPELSKDRRIGQCLGRLFTILPPGGLEAEVGEGDAAKVPVEDCLGLFQRLDAQLPLPPGGVLRGRLERESEETQGAHGVLCPPAFALQYLHLPPLGGYFLSQPRTGRL